MPHFTNKEMEALSIKKKLPLLRLCLLYDIYQKSGIAKSYDNAIFNVSRKHCIAFPIAVSFYIVIIRGRILVLSHAEHLLHPGFVCFVLFCFAFLIIANP